MNNFKATILSLSLVLLPLLGACSHDGNDDATPLVAKGGEPLIFNIAPKESFVADNPNTRATVDETTGVMTWATNDRIFVRFAFDDAAGTVATYTLVRTATATWDIYDGVAPHLGDDGNDPIDALTKATPTWPIGATKAVSVTAGYLEGTTVVRGNLVTIMSGSGSDAMTCTLTNVALNTPISLDMKHLGGRLVFTGLTSGTNYMLESTFAKLDLNNEAMVVKESSNFTLSANAGGNAVFCPILSGSTRVTLKDATNTNTVYTTLINGEAGKNYTCVKGEAGPINPDNTPNLLHPDPIVAGVTVALINGYYVTAPDANLLEVYLWNDVAVADPCANHGNWRMPTMKDWEAIVGWQTTNPWSEAVGPGTFGLPDVIKNSSLFPDESLYLSSMLREDDNRDCWVISINCMYNDGYYAFFATDGGGRRVRCVQKQ